MKPALIHSWWTRPLELDMYGTDRLRKLTGDVWMFALSLAYARREGFRIELHTDSLGAALLGHLPYDGLHRTLDAMPPELCPRFWAAGKIWALAAAGDGVVHIDGDVFIKRAALLDIRPDADLVVQSIERHSDWLWQREEPCPGWNDFCRRFGMYPQPGGDVNYNNGVLGIFNPELRREYTDSYKRFVLEASVRFGRELTEARGATPDLFIEQLWLYELAESRGDRAQLVLPEGEHQAAVLGYQHLVTQHKYDLVPKVRETLRRYFPDIYHSTELLCKNI